MVYVLLLHNSQNNPLFSVAPDMPVRSAGYALTSVRRPGGYVIRRQKMT